MPKPGIAALLERLAAEPRVTLGLLTGNLERGARLEARAARLQPLLPVRRLRERFRRPVRASADRGRAGARDDRPAVYEGKSVVIVGDSIHDVACGRALGVRAVAVATGITSPERLAAEKPDALFESFAETDRAFAAIVE